MKSNITASWKAWIDDNLKLGQDKTFIFNTLVDHGFSYNAVREEMQFEPKIKNEFDDSWNNWIDENIDLGHDKEGLFKILLLHGYSYDAIRQRLKFTPTVSLDKLENPYENNLNYPSTASLYKFKKADFLKVSPDKKQIFNHKKLEITSIEDFITHEECDYLIKKIKHKSRPSELSSYESDNKFRTSRTCDLGLLNDPIVRKIDMHICSSLFSETVPSEPIQGQYYGVGQEFKLHTDFFEEHELESLGNYHNQRTYTVMIYLNDVISGGETEFPSVGKVFQPKKGMALVWCSLNDDGSCNSFSCHQAFPVQKGFKAIITKWFRAQY